MKEKRIKQEFKNRLEYLDEALEKEPLDPDDSTRNYTIIYNQTLMMRSQMNSLKNQRLIIAMIYIYTIILITSITVYLLFFREIEVTNLITKTYGLYGC